MKDERSGMLFTEFVGLNSKIYSFFTNKNHECKKATGINKKATSKIKQRI